MRPKRIKKKLNLNKTTVTRLTGNAMAGFRGGANTLGCDTQLDCTYQACTIPSVLICPVETELDCQDTKAECTLYSHCGICTTSCPTVYIPC